MSESISSVAFGLVNATPSILDTFKRISNAIYSEVPKEDFFKVSEHLVAVTQALFAINSELVACKSKMLQLQEQIDIKENYPIVEVRPGFFAYRIEGVETLDTSSVQDVAYICQHCAEKIGREFVLQVGNKGELFCPDCGLASAVHMRIKG